MATIYIHNKNNNNANITKDMFNKRFLFFFLIVLSTNISLNVYGQKTKTVKKATATVNISEQEQAQMLYEAMLPSTEQIMIIDSVIADKNDFLSKIPLTKESGSVSTYNKFWNVTDQPSSYTYTNEFGNKIYFSKKDETGHSRLYTADKLNGKWNDIRHIKDFDDEFTDINNPFMMSDGITLYFAGKSKNNLGGYDIYVTMYDADSTRFYKPQNIGLPYNSTGNDYYCIINEFDSLGWLVTDRRQPEGKVCIYTFVPSASRTVYSDANMEEDELKALADIKSIKATWTDQKKLNAAKNRLAKLIKRKNVSERKLISFIINDNTIYTSPDEFKSEINKKRFAELCQMKQKAEDTSKYLEKLRKEYSSKPNTVLGKEIRKTENQLDQLYTYTHTLEKEIRNTENIAINNK